MIVSALAADEPALARAMDALLELRELQTDVRVAAFTSADPGRDSARLAAEHDVSLLLMAMPPHGRFGGPVTTVLRTVAADVALVAGAERQASAAGGPVVVPFSGNDHDWAALETGAWLARGLDAPLRLVGTRAGRRPDRRDASRLLASASLALQRGLGVVSESILADTGPSGVLDAGAGAAFLVAGLPERWPTAGLGDARRALGRDAGCPVLFLRKGTSLSGLAPPEALTRFTWSRVRG